MADLDGLPLKPWEKQPGESSKAYHAFIHFLQMLPHERTMAGSYTRHLKLCRNSQNPAKSIHASAEWQGWRFRHSWMERADAHDREVTETERLLRVHEIAEMNKRHIQTALGLQNVVVTKLKAALAQTKGPEMSPVQMARVLREAARIERVARGEASSITKVQSEATAARGTVLDLSRLSDMELSIFQDLIAKATPGAVEATADVE